MNETIAPSTTAAAPQETPTPAPPIAPFVEPYSHADLSPSHAAQMIEWEKDNLAKGKITPEEATRRFDALGATPEQRAPDSRSAEVKLFDQHFPAPKPEEFSVRYADPGQPTSPMSIELRAFDTHARAWLSGAEFPRDFGNSLITQIERTVHATKGMTPDQLESYESFHCMESISWRGGSTELCSFYMRHFYSRSQLFPFGRRPFFSGLSLAKAAGITPVPPAQEPAL